ncbi:SpoIIE family protein phosphatase [Quadrisphaera sp. DSM 44207]|uniref:SpoIIE family protein phosphatase n=1 Tax=Quadrisphaera sp. DSM 44207 TaxID=1881057 RepID=UPI00088E6B2F|nr:SpoIIE family protein phosphatase [Quadrisphaera sp. DSM 44207]SDQ13445.1 PAS domain S-box-containing protein [Quadrisphaera sp. DSM 44207]
MSTDPTPGIDHARLFAATPTPFLVLDPGLVIVEANDAYCRATGRRREDLVGRPMFEAFPDNPEDPTADGVANLRASLERARDTGEPHTMALQKYDIPDPATGGFVERYWSPVNVPVLDAAGRTTLLLHRVEDVTDYVRQQHQRDAERARGEGWRRRVEEAEADLVVRARELRAAWQAEAAASRRFAALAEVALQLGNAETVEDLTTVVIDRGLRVLGADGGAVGVRATEADGVLDMTASASLTSQVRERYAQMPLRGPFPASVAAATGERVLLPDRAASLAFAPEMATILAATGMQAWAALPLRIGGRVLGCLVVGWREEQEFASAEVELLEAFAAQCAQGLDRILTRQAERRSAAAVRRLSEALQRSLLTDPPQPDHLQIAVRYLPAAEEAQVGGDWYDAFVTPDGTTSVVVGDVAGHDRDAAAAMGQVRNLLRGVAHVLEAPPGHVLTALDGAMRDMTPGSLATAVLAQVEQSEEQAEQGLRLLRWSSAGHPPPLLVTADGTTQLLSAEPDLLLGLDPDTDRVDHEVELQPGTTLLLYTDGLVERRGSSLDDGLSWLCEAVAALAQLPLEQLCDALLGELQGAVEDDVALLAVRAHPEDRPRPPEAGPSALPDDGPRA